MTDIGVSDFFGLGKLIQLFYSNELTKKMLGKNLKYI